MLRVNQLASAFSRPVLVGVAFDSRACALLCSWFLVSQSSGTHACSILFLVIDFSFFSLLPPPFPFSSLALLFTRGLRLKSKEQWQKWCKSGFRPTDIPSCPYQVYAGVGWEGYGHWLGTGNQN